jgi:hypothetical protein
LLVLLHVVEIDGTERLELPNVVEVLAAYDSTIVFADNSSDPDQYPLVSGASLNERHPSGEP